jgi:prepilin-type N-terminal cleavage/methylation domain-containing protein
MKQKRSNGGFSLIEMMCTLLILVLLTMGISVSMDAGVNIYRDATFEAESATLSGILNTSLGDILRYSVDIRTVSAMDLMTKGSDIGIPDVDPASTNRYVFTSYDYGIQDAYFYIPPSLSGGNKGPIKLKNLRNDIVVDLVNTGAYPNLAVSDFEIHFSPRVAPGIEGGYFEISYTISSTSDPTKTRDVNTIVRVMND